MTQLNALPINTPQVIEIVDENLSGISNVSGEGFTQLIEQHLDNSQGCAYSDNNKETTPSEETIEQQKISHHQDSNNIEQQDIAASGKLVKGGKENIAQNHAILASEQLMTFLHKADSTLQQTELSVAQLSELSGEQKTSYKQQLLLESHKLATESVANIQVLSGQQGEQNTNQIIGQAVINEKQLQSSISARVNMDKSVAQLSVEASISAELDLQNVEKSERFLAKKSAIISHTQAAMINPKTNGLNPLVTTENIEPIIEAEQPLSKTSVQGVIQQKALANTTDQQKQLTANTKAQLLSTKDKLASTITAEQTDQNDVDKKSHLKTGEPVIFANASQIKRNISTFEQQVVELAEAKTVASNQGDTEVVQSTTPLTSKVLNSEKNTENQLGTSSTIDVNNKRKTDFTEQVNYQGNSQNVNKLTTSINAVQSGPTQVNTDHASQNQTIGQRQQNSIESLTQESQEDALAIPKSQNELGEKVEEKPAQQLKTVLSTNANFTDVSARATQVAAQAMEQHSVEQLNPTVASELIQSQKTNSQLHQETIAIFRKDFADAVKDKVMLMISQKLQQFDIKLDPPELGNMQVRVNLQSEQAAVNFIVQNQQAKEALEQNMHKLRDMLAQQGVDVGDANVEQQFQHSANEEFADNSSSHQGEETANASDVAEHNLSAQVINTSANVVDYYA
jgi:flagellar hook-length control protein FliK